MCVFPKKDEILLIKIKDVKELKKKRRRKIVYNIKIWSKIERKENIFQGRI